MAKSALHMGLAGLGLRQEDAATILGCSRDGIAKACAGRVGPIAGALAYLIATWPHLPDSVRAELLRLDAAE